MMNRHDEQTCILLFRIIFPELPKNGGPVQVYLESSQKGSSPMSEELGFLQRQISEPDEDEEK